MKDILLAQGKNVIMSKARIESREQVLRYAGQQSLAVPGNGTQWAELSHRHTPKPLLPPLIPTQRTHQAQADSGYKRRGHARHAQRRLV